MDDATRQLVWNRSQGRCEYFLILQDATPLIRFHIEHIIAKQHKTDDSPSNLAVACDRCNAYKGPNLSSIDEQTGEIVLLYNPRADTWDEHFEIIAGEIFGVTPMGRAIVQLLNMNARYRVELRMEWLKE